MKTKLFWGLMALALALGLTACTGDGGDHESDTDPATEIESVTEAESDTEAELESDTEAVTEVESETEAVSQTSDETESATLPELQWESYDAALDNSRIEVTTGRVVDQSQWIVTDGLDRVVSTNTQTGDMKDRIVAVFYWTWHGDFADKNGQKAYNNEENIQKLIEMGKSERDYVDLSVAELNTLGIRTANNYYHFWDEPIYGYYSANDEWVLRKQAELLAAADVDVVFFDNTNGTFTWLESAKRVMKVFSEARADGVDAPTVSFLLPFGANSDALTQLRELYTEIYEKNYYPDSWFYLDEKPMLMAHSSMLTTAAIDIKIREFFTFRAGVGDYLQTETSVNQWGWLSRYPQAYFHDADGNIEQMSVGVAVNHDYVNSVIAPMSLGKNIIGRTWTSKGYDTRENALLYGACFAEQWENALAVDPEIVFVTAWNEWVAMRIPSWAGYVNCFVDQYNAEYSRDCEPSAGVLKDHYYYQLVDYIRQYKGTNKIEEASDPKLIDVNGGYGQWANVSPAYNDYVGLPDRDAKGYIDPATGKRLHYTNDTGRNDVYDTKVARDYENIYFMVRTVENLTPYTDAYWMNLYIDMGEIEGVGNWENYEFILNKQNPDNATTATLERFTGNGYETEVVGKVTYSVKDNVMMVCIPKTMLGIPAEEMEFSFGFKWTDNTLVGDDGDIMKWYTNGEVAPVGRFNYCYTTGEFDAYTAPDSKGNCTVDLTDADVVEDLLGNNQDSTGVSCEMTADGLKVTSTAVGDEALLVLHYENLSPRVLLDRCDSLVITYRVVTNTTDSLRVCISNIENPATILLNRSRTLNLETDGNTHTVTMKLQSLRIMDGYLNQVGIYFGKDAAAGQSIIIEKIEFVNTSEAAS